ncbi:fas-binding factor 1-like [Branchiostoma floridae]|uniref:Fas-binding factor 1-like n=1 Tax=Branchiostoma floridae TaxID=7739 RepID=A0A9J7M5J0_BRAFL|nr:fas-binding factor 1-like [Branchiostoma floridae]
MSFPVPGGRKRPGRDDPPKQKTSSSGRQRTPEKSKVDFDEDFYANLAAEADFDEESEVSEADPQQVVGSMGDIDDMDAELFGSSLKRKKTPPSRGSAVSTPPSRGGENKPLSPSLRTKSGSPTSARKSVTFSDNKKPATTSSDVSSSYNVDISVSVGPDKDSSTKDSQSPEPARKPGSRGYKGKKFQTDFGDFDEDDPLAGLLSDEEDAPKKKKPAKKTPQRKVTEETQSSPGAKPGGTVPRAEEISPRMSEPERPRTSHGRRQDEPEEERRVQTAPPAGQQEKKQPEISSSPRQEKTTASRRGKPKREEISFDDDDDDLMGTMGFDDSPRQEKKVVQKKQEDQEDLQQQIAAEEEQDQLDDDGKSAKSRFDALLGVGTAKKLLERPGTGERKEFSLDKYKKPQQDEKKEKEPTEEDFNFGSYMPSAAAKTPPSRGRPRTGDRSVRFEDDDDIFGSPQGKTPSRGGRRSALDDLLDPTPSAKKPPTPKSGKLKTPAEKDKDSDWLGLKDSDNKSNDPSDWLGMTTSSKTDQSGTISDSTPAKKEGKDTSSSAADFLGLGDEVDPDTLTSSTRGHQDAPFRSTVDEGKADIFTAPALRDQTSPFPWDGPTGGRPRRRQPGTAGLLDSGPISPRDTGPLDDDPVRDHPPLRRSGDPLSMDDPLAMDGPVDPLGPVGPLPRSSPVIGRDHQQPELPRRASQPARRGPQMGEGQQHMQVQPPSQPAIGQARPLPTPSVPQGHTGTYGANERLSLELQQQADMFKQQQEMLARQNQEMVRQQQEQIKALHMQQERLMQQISPRSQMASHSAMAPQSQMTPNYQLPTYQLPTMGHSPANVSDLESKIRQLQAERDHLQIMLESSKHRHQEELSSVEEAHKARLQLAEESFQRREARLREENEQLVTQHLARLKTADEEKAQVQAAHHKKVLELQAEKSEELERIKELHRKSVQELQSDHEDQLNRLHRMREQEIEAATSATRHTRSLQSVVQKVEENAKNLGQLSFKLEGHHISGLEERETAARELERQLKLLQERLGHQQEENERERTRLQDLIGRLEARLTEQGRQLEEERWKVKSEQNRVQALQKSLEEERRYLSQQLAMERESVQRAKNELMEEQKQVMAQCAEERRKLATEWAEFHTAERVAKERATDQSARSIKTEAERESTIKSLAQEQASITVKLNDLRLEEERLNQEKIALNEKRQALDAEAEKMAYLSKQVARKSEEIETVSLEAAQNREEGQRALVEARRVEAEQDKRLGTIESQLQYLRQQEKQIAEERLSLAKDKRDLEQTMGSYVCINCRTPVRDNSRGFAQQPINIQQLGPQPINYQQVPQTLPQSLMTSPSQGLSSPQIGMVMPSPESSYTAALPSSVLDSSPQPNGSFGSPQHENGVIPVPFHPAMSPVAADLARKLLNWKNSSERDKEYLDNEKFYLETLKHSPYHSNSSSPQKVT